MFEFVGLIEFIEFVGFVEFVEFFGLDRLFGFFSSYRRRPVSRVWIGTVCWDGDVGGLWDFFEVIVAC